MNRNIILLTLGFALSIAFADTATQSDWSYGPGLWLQDLNWIPRFYSNSNVEYLDPGCIKLLISSEKYNISEGVDGSRGIYSEDIDGDGDKDILVAMQSDIAAIIWLENTDGTGTSWTDHTVDGDLHTPLSVYSQDMDGDGDMDVLGVDHWYDYVVWWENVDGAGVNWTEHTIDESFSDPLSIYCNDIDNDGYMDVIATGSAGYLSWWRNVDGTGSNWLEHPVDSLIGYSPSVCSEDIDGDGSMDILGTSFSKNDVIWWENADDSGTVFIKHVIDQHFTSAHSICSVDMNGDGYMDVLCAGVGEWDNNTNMVLGGVKWWENSDGSGTTWIEHEIDTSSGAVAVHSVDLDDDGNMDVISTNYDTDNVQWYTNEDGTGTQWNKNVLLSFHIVPYDRAIYSADLNGDGKPDILGSDDVRIVWWDLNIHAMAGWLESSCLFLGNDPGWGSIDWSDSEPAGTSVSFQVRASDSPDSTEMGAWSDTLFAPCSLAGILDEYDSFFQYRVILQRSDSTVSPVLEDVTITWDPVGIDGGEPCELRLLPVFPNPSSGFPVLRFSLPESGSVELSVFDLSGRMVQAIEENEYSAGYHEIQMESLSSGIYFCRMTVGDFIATQRFVVVQ